MMPVDPAYEPSPGPAGATVLKKEVRAVLVGCGISLSGPVVVSPNVLNRDTVMVHQRSCEFGSPIHRLQLVVALVLTHFDSDGVAIARAVEVGVFSSLVGRDVLDHGIVLHRKVPAEIPDDTTSQRASLEGFCMGIGITSGILGAVNRDVLRFQLAKNATSVAPLGNEVDFQIQLLVKLVRAFRSIGDSPKLTLSERALDGGGVIRAPGEGEDEAGNQNRENRETERFHLNSKRW